MTRNYRLLFILIAMFASFSLLSACASSAHQLSLQEKESMAQHLIKEKDFVGIFEKAVEIGHEKSSSNYIVSEQVIEYFKANGDTRENVIRTLESNGFKVYTGNTFAPKNRNNERSYDEEIYGERKNTPFHLYRYITYKVYVYMNSGKVDRVIAHAYSDGL